MNELASGLRQGRPVLHRGFERSALSAIVASGLLALVAIGCAVVIWWPPTRATIEGARARRS